MIPIPAILLASVLSITTTVTPISDREAKAVVTITNTQKAEVVMVSTRVEYTMNNQRFIDTSNPVELKISHPVLINSVDINTPPWFVLEPVTPFTLLDEQVATVEMKLLKVVVK